MDIKSRLTAVLEQSGKPIDIATIHAKLLADGDGAVSQKEIVKILDMDPFFSEVESGYFSNTASLVNGVSFFAVPEDADVENGRLYIIGSELVYLLQSAIRKDSVVFESEHGDVTVALCIEDSDFFYFSGLGEWYEKSGFESGEDSVFVQVLDYEEPRYAIRKVSEEVLDNQINADVRERLCDQVAELLENSPEIFSKDSKEEVSAGALLRFLLAQRAFDFSEFPVNISFYLSLDERFFVSGNFVRLQSEGEDYFSQFYLGDDLEMAIEERDVEKLDNALSSLFEKGEPKEAQVVLKQLKLKYPQERLLDKFLYQSAYFLEDDEAVLRYTKEYSEAFPRDPDPYRTAGEVYFKNGNFEQAEEAFTQSMGRIHPEDNLFRSDLYTIWMYLRYDSNDIKGAVSMGMKALEADPNNEEAVMFLEDQGYTAEVTRPNLKEVSGKKNGKIINVDFGMASRTDEEE